MGEIFRATDLATQERVALKLLNKSASPGEHARFRREVEVLAELRHPGIVAYVDHGEWSDGRPYFAMEWLEGEDLGQRQNREPLGMNDAVEVVRRAAQALAAIHARGVIHRDIKLSNIFIVNRSLTRGVKLIDFGVVKLPHPDEYPTLPGSIIGTPHFMAPEQARGERVDARADVYSLGSVLFKLVTGRHVFEADHIIALLSRLVIEEPPLASSVRFDVPEPLDRLLASTLSRNPSDRPEDAGALARKLARLPAMTNEPPNADSSASAIRVILDTTPVDDDRPRETTKDSNAPPQRPGALERRIVAVVLASVPLTGMPVATSMKVRAVIGDDARFEALQGGKVVAALGVARTQGDEAVRAARAALIIATSVPDARVAVATGHAVTGRRGITGEALGRAAVQLERARPGGIRVDKATYPLLEGRFTARLDAKGAVLLHEDLAAMGSRKLLGKTTPTVGRDREVALLYDTFNLVESDRIPRCVIVSGPAGIGKTRLRHEVMRRLSHEHPALDVLIARGDPMLAHTGLSALGRALRQRMGIRDGEPLSLQAERVVRYVEQRPTCHEQSVYFLGEFVGVPFNDQDSEPLRAARDAPQLMTARIIQAMEAVIRHDATVPQILLLEDLQCIDEMTLEITDWLLACQDIPLTVYALGRPEFAARFPALFATRAMAHLELAPLPPADCEELIAAVGLQLDHEHRRRLIERSEGNALFLEELIRHASEGRDDLPMSVQTLVQARVDDLPPEQRTVLRAASVFGRQFWTDGVSELLGRDCQQDLEALASAEVITAQDVSRIDGQSEWMFAHGLVQETAYAALIPEDRTSMHKAASEWLLIAGEEDIGAIARHAEAGGDKSRAAVLYGRAAAKAYANGQLLTALDAADRGVACAEEPALRAQCLLQKAQVLNWLGRFDEQIEAAEATGSFAEPGTDLWGEAQRLAAAALREQGRPADSESRLGWTLEHPLAEQLAPATRARLIAERTRSLNDLGRIHEALAAAEEAVRIATEAGDAGTTAMLRALDARFMALTYQNDQSASIEAARAVIERADQVGDGVLATRARVNMGFVLHRLGRFEQSREVLERGLGEARMLRMRAAEGFALHNLGMALGRLDELDEAVDIEQQAVRLADEISHSRLQVSARTYEAILRAWRGAPGDLSAALTCAETARMRSAAQPMSHVASIATIALIQLARRDLPAAYAAAEEASRRASSLGAMEEGEEMLRLTCIEVLIALDRIEEADELLRAAYDWIMLRADSISAQVHRDSYLSRLYEVRRIIDLAVERLGVDRPLVSSEPPPPVVPKFSARPGPLRTTMHDEEPPFSQG